MLQSFFAKRIHILETLDSELCDLFGLDAESPRIPEPTRICPFELALILQACLDSRHDWQKLQWWERVNTDAVERILGKLGRREQADNPSCRVIGSRFQALRKVCDSKISSGLERLRFLMADAKAGVAPPLPTSGMSLYLARVDFPRPWSKPFTDDVIQAVQSGNSAFVVEALTSTSSMPGVSGQEIRKLTSELLRYSIMLRLDEPDQTRTFLRLLPSPEELLIQHQVIKWAIRAVGRDLDCSHNPSSHRQHYVPIVFQLLGDILAACKQRLSEVLLAEDDLGRRPGHYAAMYGVPGDASWEMFLPFEGDGHTNGGSNAPQLSDGPLESNSSRGQHQVFGPRDIEGLTPFHIAVLENHGKSVWNMAVAMLNNSATRRFPHIPKIAGELIPVALMNTRGDDFEVFLSLVFLGGRTTGGLAALPVAAQVGYTQATSFLLGASTFADSYHADSENREFEHADRRGWTALFHACALGEYEIVKRLLDSNFSQKRTDDMGWTAKEYAVLNGHLDVAALFEPSGPCDMTDGPARVPAQMIAYPKLYCAEGERIIIASLGTERVDKVVTEVSLSYCSSVYTPSIHEGLSYALEISAPGTTAQPRVVKLPILDDQINDPIIFPIPATVEPQLVFKVIRLGAEDDGQHLVVGSGTALLEGNNKQFGAGRQSLIREHTIPILDLHTMAVAGTVTFTFLVGNHFPHLQTPREVDISRKAGQPPALIGHRGLGQNLKTHEYLQIGENTVESFVSAAKLGASFVEFDVQVTKDHEAVIFHDFSLSESGTDAPVHDLTLAQFMYASKIQSPHGNPLSVLGPGLSRDEPGRKRKRSRSVGGHFEAGAIQIRDRMKHTADFKNKGFKPNTRGDFIQDSFATLKELLSQVPEHVGFDIEISSLLAVSTHWRSEPH